jgi:hypothetical protein
VWFPIMSSKVPTIELGHNHLVLLSPPACPAA